MLSYVLNPLHPTPPSLPPSMTDIVICLLLLMTMYTVIVYLPPRMKALVTFVSGY